METYCLTVLETRKSVSRAVLPLKVPGKNLFHVSALALVALGIMSSL